MEILDTIEAWQIEEDDLIQFEAYKEGERYVELMRVLYVTQDIDEGCVRITGESMVSGGREDHEVDFYLEVEIMGA